MRELGVSTIMNLTAYVSPKARGRNMRNTSNMTRCYMMYLIVALSLINVCNGGRASTLSSKRTPQAHENNPILSINSGGAGELTNIKTKLPLVSLPKVLQLNELDKRIIRTAIPTVLNFAINPIVGSVTLYYVGKMKNTLALAGMAAANQVYFSAFILFSYLPSSKYTHTSTTTNYIRCAIHNDDYFTHFN